MSRPAEISGEESALLKRTLSGEVPSPEAKKPHLDTEEKEDESQTSSEEEEEEKRSPSPRVKHYSWIDHPATSDCHMYGEDSDGEYTYEEVLHRERHHLQGDHPACGTLMFSVHSDDSSSGSDSEASDDDTPDPKEEEESKGGDEDVKE